MKKLLSFLLVSNIFFFAATVKSQPFLQLYDNGGNIPNGTVIHVWGDHTLGTIMSKHCNVKNSSPSEVTVDVKKIENSLIPGASCNICFAGQCYTSSVDTAINTSTLGVNETDTTFSGDYKPKGNLGESIITFVFYNISDPNDSAGIIVHFHGSAVGITENALSEVIVSDLYPLPAVNQVSLNYFFPFSAPKTSLILCDITGRMVREEPIINKEGKLSINTGTLQNGLYFYSVSLNDKILVTKKLVINH